MHHTEATARARIFVEQAYSAEMSKLATEYRTKLAAAQNDMSARGLVLSGMMTAEIARLKGEMIAALVTKRLLLWLEGSDRHDVTITDEVAREILNDVLALRNIQIQNAARVGAQVGGQQLPGGSGDGYLALIEQYVAISPAEVRTEIDRHRFPRRTQKATRPDLPANVTHHTEVHIHGDTIANLNLGSQIGTINNALQQISQSDPALVEALKTLTEQITENQAFSAQSKRESVEAVTEILKQARTKPEERSKFTIRGAVDLLVTTLKAAPELAHLAEKYLPVIRGHFGL